LELTLDSRLHPANEKATNTPWSVELSTGGNTPAEIIDWEHLTEFDVRDTIFHNGKWGRSSP
jgi:hypothetical protein